MADTFWSQTYTGKAFDYADPTANEYVLEDIAHHLSQVIRYGGACIYPYSVAQHSTALATYIWKEHRDPFFALEACFHDAAEAYTGDIRTPMKDAMPGVRELEDTIQSALLRYVVNHYSIPVPLTSRPLMKEYDRRIVNDEKAQMMNPCERVWYGMDGYPPLGVPTEYLKPMTAKLAKDLWLQTVWFLTDHANN